MTHEDYNRCLKEKKIPAPRGHNIKNLYCEKENIRIFLSLNFKDQFSSTYRYRYLRRWQKFSFLTTAVIHLLGWPSGQSEPLPSLLAQPAVTLAPVTLAEFSPTPAGGHSGHEPAHLPFVQPHRAGLDETAEFVVAARLRGLWWAARQGPGDVISRSFLGSSLRLALCQVRPGNKKKSKNSAPVFSSRSIKKNLIFSLFLKGFRANVEPRVGTD